MPEQPDVVLYVSLLDRRLTGHRMLDVRVRGPFVVRTTDPPIDALIGEPVAAVSRLGKRVVLAFGNDLFCAIHLMVAGRLRWFEPGSRAGAGKSELVSWRFEPGTLVLTEAGTTRRAAVHIVRGREALHALSPPGLEVLDCTTPEFTARLRIERRTLKRALTDPRLFSGIGNAYSDEILHRARLSPIQLTTSLDDDACGRLHVAAREVLTLWTAELAREFGLDRGPGRFPGPGEITAFRPGFGVHGKFRQPCPVCAAPVQRIVRAENECNYCPVCQTGGKILADRSLSRLLKDDWPRTVDELDA